MSENMEVYLLISIDEGKTWAKYLILLFSTVKPANDGQIRSAFSS